MKFLKCCSSVTLALVLLLFTTQSAHANTTVVLSEWDLVDSGKHLDVAGSTKYQSSFDDGIRIWINYKMGIIRTDSIFVIEDVTISDCNTVDNYSAITYPDGRIEFNTYYMDKYEPAMKQKTCAHEIGHALGLDHNISADVMYAYSSSVTSLTDNDKASFDTAYTRY